jgi:hypothetical protein
MDRLLVKDYIQELLGEIDAARDKHGEDFYSGKLIAYNEILSKLQRLLIAESPDALVDYGLGFDIDVFVTSGTQKQLELA